LTFNTTQQTEWNQWRHGRIGLTAPPKKKNWGLSENFHLIGKSSSNNTKFGAEKTPFGEFRGKIEILSTHNLFCQEFAAVCWKTATFFCTADATA